MEYQRLMEAYIAVMEQNTALKRHNKNTQRKLERALIAKDKLAAGNLNQFQVIDNFDKQPATVVGSFLETVKVASEKDTVQSNVDEPKRKGGVPGRSNTFWSLASEQVMILVPGPKSSRVDENGEPIGGVEANSRRLRGKVIGFFKSGMMSLRDHAESSARELAIISDEVRAKAPNGRGGYRRAWNKEKPADVLGYISPETLKQGVHAMSFAIDTLVVDIIKKAKLVFLSVDSSTLGLSTMQSTHWAAYEIEISGYDAAGNPLMKIVFCNGFLNALPVQNKGTVACTDEDGKEMNAFAPEKLALAFIIAGIAVIILKHKCVAVCVDGGNEGGGSGSTIDTCCYAGEGGFLNDVFVTRKALEQAITGREDIVGKLGDFYGVDCEEDLELREQRPAPRRLRTNRPVMKLDGRTVSMKRNPLQYLALFYGGVPRVRHCCKHVINLSFLDVMKEMISFVKDLLSVVLFFRNVWVLMKIKPAVQGIFGLPGARQYQYHISAAGRIPPNVFEMARNRLLRSAFKMIKESAMTRWATVQEGAGELHGRWAELVSGMAVGLGKGTDQARLDMVEDVFSPKGFQEKNMIVFSPKIGKNFWRMNDPSFRWGLMLLKFFQVTVWGPIMAASSENKESSLRSMGGVGSVLRRILFFLEFKLFVHIPRGSPLPNPGNDANTRRETARRRGLNWFMDRFAVCIPVNSNQHKVDYPLAHRGVPTRSHPEGFLMLNSHLERERSVSRLPAKAESGMKHLFGRFHKPEMDTIFTELASMIETISKLEPGDGRNFLSKGLRDLVDCSQTTVLDRQKALLKSVLVLSKSIVTSIVRRYDRYLYDPHAYLASIIDVNAVPAKKIRSGDACEFMVSTHEARANAGILQILLKELGKSVENQLRPGESLGDYLTGPVGEFYRDRRLLEQLDAFLKADNVRLPADVIENQGLTELTADRHGPISMVDMKHKLHGTPKPFTAFPSLAEQALIANAEPTSNSRVEGGFSLASGKWRASSRNVSARWWSQLMRKKTMQNAGLEDTVKSDGFLQTFEGARRFCAKNSEALKRLWHLDLAEAAHRDRMRKNDQLPQYVKDGAAFVGASNIAPPKMRTGRKDIEPASRQGGAKGNKRHRDSDHSDFEDSDAEHSELADEEEKDAECEDEDLAPLDLNADRDDPDYFQHHSLGQEHNNQPSSTSGHRQREQNISMAPQAPVEAAMSAVPESDMAQHPSQEWGGSEAAAAASDDNVTAGVCLPVASNAEASKATSGPQGMSSVAVERQEHVAGAVRADSEPMADSDEDLSAAQLDALEAAADAGTADLRKLLERGVDSEVSESEDESESRSLSVVSAQDRARWEHVKAENRPYLIQHATLLQLIEPWKDSKVSKKGSRCGNTEEGFKRLWSLTVERTDGIVIPVHSKDGNMLYLVAESDGPEIVYITEIFESSEGDAKIKYLRVLDTRNAYISCDRDEDIIESLEGGDRVCVHTRRLGKKSLQALLDSRGDTLHHWGDVTWVAPAKHIIGLVGWLPVAIADDSQSKVAACGQIKSKVLGRIRSADDLDWVIIGEQFSDCIPDTDEAQEPISQCSERSSRGKKGAAKTASKAPTPAASGGSPNLHLTNTLTYIVETVSSSHLSRESSKSIVPSLTRNLNPP